MDSVTEAKIMRSVELDGMKREQAITYRGEAPQCDEAGSASA